MWVRIHPELRQFPLELEPSHGELGLIHRIAIFSRRIGSQKLLFVKDLLDTNMWWA